MNRLVPILIALSIYSVSLFLPAVHGGGTSLIGLVLLFLGWVQIFDLQCFAWVANPIIGLAALLFATKNYKESFYTAVLACIIGLDTFRATVFSANEGGSNIEIESIGIAFYVWEMSFVFLALISWHRAKIFRGAPP